MNNENDHVRTVPQHVIRAVFWTSVFVALAACLFVLWGGIATARNAADRNDCRDILESLFARLENQHAEVNGDALKSYLKEVATGVGDNAVSHSGPNRDVLAAYIILSNPPSSENTNLTVLACDKPGNHVIHLANGLRERRNGKIQEQALLLLSNGHAAVWIGDSTEYEKWVADVVDGIGDPFPPGIEQRLLR